VILGVILAAPPGGNYSAQDLRDFVAEGHRTAVVVGLVLSLIGVLGLLVLVTHLRRVIAGRGRDADLVWGIGLLSVAGFAIGSVLIDVVPLGLANGGHRIPDAVTYMLTQAGFAAGWGVGGTFLAVALLVWAAGAQGAVPSWLRWFAIAAGVIGLFSLAFFPFFILLVWALVAGIWLLVSGPSDARGEEIFTEGEQTA
jgi:hypothetical protein